MRDAIWRGVDPTHARKAAKAAIVAAEGKRLTFREAAKRCHEKKAPEFKNEKNAAQWLAVLEIHAFPKIGDLGVADLEQRHVMDVLEPIWRTKTETATRVRQRIENVFTWATVAGFRSGENPARWSGNLKELLPTPSKIMKVVHHPALPWQDVPAFMTNLRSQEGMGARALEFAIHTAARSGEVRGAMWPEIDFDAKVWTLSEKRMKGDKVHKVPLNEEAIRILRSLDEDTDFIFPAMNGKMISDMTMSAVTRRMGVPAVPHGFRSSFKDWARNCTSYADEVSELALAHVSNDATRAAYARDGLLSLRAQLMRDWGRFLVTAAKAVAA
jgi:integrase